MKDLQRGYASPL